MPSFVSLEQKDHAHTWDTVGHSEDTAKKNKPSQRDTHHYSPDSRVPFPPQGRQEDCCKFKAGQGYTGEMVQKYKTDNNNNIMVGTETGGSMVAPGCKEWDWDLLFNSS